MPEPITIHDDAIYDDATLRAEARLAASALARARKSGLLRYTRRAGRTLYLGRWVRDWLTGSGAQAPEAEREAAPC